MANARQGDKGAKPHTDNMEGIQKLSTPQVDETELRKKIEDELII